MEMCAENVHSKQWKVKVGILLVSFNNTAYISSLLFIL